MPMKRIRALVAVNILTAGLLALGTPAHAAGGIKAGVLNCNVATGWGFVFSSTRDLKCTYTAHKNGPTYHYLGHISKFGVDIGYVSNGVLIWGVIAPTHDIGPEALTGRYGGVTGGAAVGVGVGANALFGGSNNAISLQPLSVEGNEGLNVAAGVAEISLKYEPQEQQPQQPQPQSQQEQQ